MRKFVYCGLVLNCLVGIAMLACSSDKGSGNESGGTAGTTSSTSSIGGNGSGGRNSGGTYAAGGATKPFTGGIEPSGTSTGPSKECAQRQVPIKALPPDILIVMDRSMSMTADAEGKTCAGGSPSGDANCGTASKWYQTIEAIKSVVSDTQTTVNWGMFWLGNERTQCGASTTPAVPITSGDSITAITAAFDGNVFDGEIGTPTAAVVKNSVQYLKTLTDENPKFLLVATDGEPNCARSTSVGTSDATGATNAVTEAAAEGIPTFVVGIATASSAAANSALDSMAVAGGKPQTSGATKYYAVSDTDTLKAVLNEIIGLAASCTVSLENTPEGEWTIAISAKDATDKTIAIPNDPANGWSYTDTTTKSSIILSGEACDNLKTGKYSNLQFVYTCPEEEIVLQ